MFLCNIRLYALFCLYQYIMQFVYVSVFVMCMCALYYVCSRGTGRGPHVQTEQCGGDPKTTAVPRAADQSPVLVQKTTRSVDGCPINIFSLHWVLLILFSKCECIQIFYKLFDRSKSLIQDTLFINSSYKNTNILKIH